MRKILAFSAVTAFANPPKPIVRVEPVLTATHSGLSMPAKKAGRGSSSLYPFASLTVVGMCFGIKNKKAANLSSIISVANKRHQVAATDENGNPIFATKELTAADGTKSVVPDFDKPKTVPTAHFFAEDVTPERAKELKGTPLEGSTVLVWRDK